MSARAIERGIEEACETLLSSRSYITSNSIPVRRYGDGDVEVSLRQVAVRCHELECSNIGPIGGGTHYTAKVEFYAYVPIASDKNQAYLDGLYEELRLAASSFTTSSISPIGIVILGKIMDQGQDEYSERLRMKSCAFKIFINVTEAN